MITTVGGLVMLIVVWLAAMKWLDRRRIRK